MSTLWYWEAGKACVLDKTCTSASASLCPALFDSTIVHWQHVLHVFSENATVDRSGSFPAPGGWIWMNFFWARASYIKKLVEPIRTDRRHYYEDWLGRIYDAATDSNKEPGKFAGCVSCYLVNGVCSGYGVT